MHRCLQIPELIGRFACEAKACNRVGSVAAMARACRTFLEPALDVLWMEQEELDNLIKSLPGDALNFEDVEVIVSFLTLMTHCLLSHPNRPLLVVIEQNIIIFGLDTIRLLRKANKKNHIQGRRSPLGGRCLGCPQSTPSQYSQGYAP